LAPLPAPVIGELDGKALKFIKVAERLFAKEHRDMNSGVIVVSEGDEYVYVLLTTKERLAMSESTFGGPGYMVTISKKDMRILDAYDLR
jgi:hypothetical protein